MNNSKNHQKLVDDVLFAVGRLSNVRLWIRVVGMARPIHNDGNVLQFGIRGESDLQGIIAPHGRMLAIECKTGSGVLNADQKRWKEMIEKFGGVYILGKSVEQVLAELKKFL